MTETLCFVCERNYFTQFMVFELFHRSLILIEVFMRDFVKGFGEIKQDGIYLAIVIYGCYPVMDCIHKLGLTREPLLETVLEVDMLMMLCLCKFFHMLQRVMCSVTLQRIYINEMSL